MGKTLGRVNKRPVPRRVFTRELLSVPRELPEGREFYGAAVVKCLRLKSARARDHSRHTAACHKFTSSNVYKFTVSLNGINALACSAR